MMEKFVPLFFQTTPHLKRYYRILSCSIFIAERHNNKILVILLKDYAKTKVTKSQFMFVLMLVVCYRENNIFINDNFYKLLSAYITVYSNSMCRSLFLLYHWCHLRQ